MSRDVYMNPLQQRIYYANARNVRVLAARRFGKTDGVIGPRLWRVANSMPQGIGIIGGNSRKQLYTRTIPAMIAAVCRFFGFTEGIHFGWGRPPKGTPMPVQKPKTWENVLWFANGFIYQLVSMAVSGSANGMTVNAIILDECKFLSKAKIDAELTPTLSGLVHPLGDKRFSDENPLYKSTLYVSDAAITSKGNWLEKEEQTLDLRLDTEFDSWGKHFSTYGDIQRELDHWADRTAWWNDFLRSCKQGKYATIVVSEEKRTEILAVVDGIKKKTGPFKILPHTGSEPTKHVIDMLLSYRIIKPEDAELIFNYKYLITQEEDFELMMIRNSSKFKQHMNLLRCNGFNFYRASSLDNIDILGESYISAMRRSLSPILFAISILNMKMKKSGEGFYCNLDLENVHGYVSEDCPAIDASYKKKTAEGVLNGQKVKREFESFDFTALSEIEDCTKDGDVVDALPLHIAGDWNAHINWFVVGQLYKRDNVEALNVVNSLFVKNGELLKALCRKFDHYYRPHKRHCRTVYFYYDQTAKFKGYAIEGSDDFANTVINELTQMGWEVCPCYIGQAPAHEAKYKVINEGLAGCTYPAIRFNRENNEALLIAMENTEVQIGYKGFRKDKSGEKLAESHVAESDNPSTPYELRTDGTDAFDSLYWGVKYHRMQLGGLCMPTGR